MNINKIKSDKLLHFIGGMLIQLISSRITPNPIWALLIVIVIGIGKEIYDNQHKECHTPEILDAIATIAGGLVVYILTFGLY